MSELVEREPVAGRSLEGEGRLMLARNTRSTRDQDLALQLNELTAAGCAKVYIRDQDLALQLNELTAAVRLER